MIQSTVSEPETFEAALLCLFRDWTFEQKMMELIARREKDVIKNDFAKLGLFEGREAKFICRKLNRFFTTHTFQDNFPHLKTDQITKFVIENSLMDLLAEKFIDYRYIKLLLENLDVIYMREELVLVEKIHDLMSPETKLSEFLSMVNVTSDYISEFDKNFDRDQPALKLTNATLQCLSSKEFHEISTINSFTQNLMTKMESREEQMPNIQDLLESYHSINLEFVRDEFETSENVSFNDNKLSSSYSDIIRLNYLNYVQQHQSAFGTYKLIKEIIKNFMAISRPQLMTGCEEVAKLAVENPENIELVSHVMSFLEMFGVDSRNLRCLLRLFKLKSANDESKAFETFLDETIKVGTKDSEMCNLEALEVFWSTKKIKDPPRSYLNGVIASNDWFKLVLLAQYFDYPVNSLVSICDERMSCQALRDNLIRAVLFDSSPEMKKRCSFSKRRRSRTVKNEVSCSKSIIN